MDTASVRVLVVDDFEPWRRFVSSTLQKQPEYRVICEVSDGLEAVKKAQELQPDLILLDIGLPTLNGIEAARRIREHAPQSRILFFSENCSPDVAEEALRTGAGGYVLKSDAARELLPAVEAVLQDKQFVSVSLAGRVLVNTKGEQGVEHRVPLASANAAISHRHEVAFYPDDTFLVDSFARIVESALKIGNAVIVIATNSHLAGILHKLRVDAVDVDAVVEQGSYIPCDVDNNLSAFMVNNVPEPVRFRKSAGDLIEQAAKVTQGVGRRVVACGECAPTLLAEGNEEATIRIERLWDEIARSYDVDILCGYLAGAFPGKDSSPIFQRICAEHSGVRGD